MSYQSDIQAIVNDGTLTDVEKSSSIADIKMSAMQTIVKNNLPYTVNLTGNRDVTFTKAIISKTASNSAMIYLWGDFKRNGVSEAFDWPWILVNPPLMDKAKTGNTTQAIVEVVDQVFV